MSIGFERWRLELCAARLKFKSPFTDGVLDDAFEDDSVISLLVGGGFTRELELDADRTDEVDLARGADGSAMGALEEATSAGSKAGGADGAPVDSPKDGELEWPNNLLQIEGEGGDDNDCFGGGSKSSRFGVALACAPVDEEAEMVPLEG